MKKIITLICLATSLATVAQSSNFENYSNFEATTNGNMIVTAMTKDNLGNTYLTGRLIETVDFDPGIGVTLITSQPTSNYNTFILKLGANDQLIWVKTIKSDSLNQRDITIDNLGNVLITGTYSFTFDIDPSDNVFELPTPVNSGFDGYILKLNNNGDFVWAKTLGSFGSEIGTAITTDSQGNVLTIGNYSKTADFDPGPNVVLLTGTFGNFDDNIFVSKLDPNGNFIWVRGYLTKESNEFIKDIKTDSNDAIYILDRFGNNITFEQGNPLASLVTSNNGGFVVVTDPFILKLSSAGNFIWAKNIGTFGTDTGHHLALDTTGNIYAAISCEAGTVDCDPGVGVFNLTSTTPFGLVLKMNNNGQFITAFKIESSINATCVGIAVEANENVIITGNYSGTSNFGTSLNPASITSIAPNKSLYIARYDNTNTLINLKNVNTETFPTAVGLIEPKDVIIDNLNRVQVVSNYLTTITLSKNGEPLTTFSTSLVGDRRFFKIIDPMLTNNLYNYNFKQTANINIYPNLTNSILNIDISENATLQITDLLGKTVLEKSITSGKNTFTIEALPTGMYISKIQNENGIYNQKIMKN